MHYTIKQLSATTWALVAADGTTVATFDDTPGRTGYQLATAALAGIIGAELEEAAPLATGDDAGLLPEWWTSDAGIAFSVATPGGRDFSQCAWSWRDPQASLLPVMFQTQNLPAHMEAELAGFVTDFTGGGIGAVGARGRFYDTEVGRAARDVLLGGRRFGVSVDPTENVDYSESFDCVAYDDEGECVDGTFAALFSAYEIGGFTMEPHPCFEQASIVLEGARPMAFDDATLAAAIAASVTVPARPPSAWFELAEPRPGQPFLDGMGDDVLVPQRDRDGIEAGLACPLTITDDGLVYAHLTYWGQCHTGDPWGPGRCASASPSRNGYADFHAGTVIADDGTVIPVGPLTVGCEHSYAMTASGVRDHMAHAGMGWADVRAIDGEYGVWVCGALRPGVTDEQLRILRALSISGEWVGELAGALSVNASGLPVQRLAASAFPPPTWVDVTIPAAALRASAQPGGLSNLVGANIVRPCPECGKRTLRASSDDLLDTLLGEIRAVRQQGEMLERRTRHLVGEEIEAARATLNVTPR